MKRIMVTLAIGVAAVCPAAALAASQRSHVTLKGPKRANYLKRLSFTASGFAGSPVNREIAFDGGYCASTYAAQYYRSLQRYAVFIGSSPVSGRFSLRIKARSYNLGQNHLCVYLVHRNSDHSIANKTYAHASATWRAHS
jgi:hypothetical protein